MGDLDGGLPYNWEEDPDLLSDPLRTTYDNDEVNETWQLEQTSALPDSEDGVPLQGLEALAPPPFIDDELSVPPIPGSPMLVDAIPEAPLKEQPVFDEDGKKIGTILPAMISTPRRNISVDIPSSTLTRPASLYQGEELRPSEREWVAVRSLLQEVRQNSDDGEQQEDFIEFKIDDFAVYIDATVPGGNMKVYKEKRYPCEMRPLQHLSIQKACTQMYVDGVLSAGDKRFFVRQIPFDELPIGNYGASEATVGSEVWIRSKFNVAIADKKGPDVYYRLGSPALEYRRYYVGFVWVADLAKHVVDYLSVAIEQSRSVIFRDFRSDFSRWLADTHGHSDAFSKWRRQYSGEDFCTAIVPNVDFIYKEAYGVLGHRKATSIYLWREIREFTAFADSQKKILRAAGSDAYTPQTSPSPAPKPPKTRQPADIPRTVVTPYINDLFHHLPCGPMMEATSPSASVEKLRRGVIRGMGLEEASGIHTAAKDIVEKTGQEVRVGDVVSTHRDDNEDYWVREAASGFNDVDCWFGLVQKLHNVHNSRQKSFDVIWIYTPTHTLCGTMRYPWNNELFLSDHCTCGDAAVGKIKEDEVLAVHKVDWGGSSGTDAEFFCRQTYLHEERKWITFREQHLRCPHRQARPEFPYLAGDTLLVSLEPGNATVEPCELVALPDTEGEVTFRRLERRHRLQPDMDVSPNEIVYTDDEFTLGQENIHGRCLVRVFRPDEKIPPPYDRNGVGNAFFITQRWRDGVMIPIEDAPIPLRQGFDPRKHFYKLRGFDLFCGGGNFGRGLEEGGAIEMKWANDINVKAIHTYMANTTNTVHPFAGSIDDLQRLALQGKFCERVPEIGMVDFISGGSPCPGFPRLTIDKATPEQRKNQSLVAAFASFVDTYRPRYGLLENVMEILQPKGRRGEDVFSQLICALVGLGYQAGVFLLDAWNYGSPQSRSRIFLCFAAPGLALPDMPLHSHSHYTAKIRSRGLGWIPNGNSMVDRLIMPTPFKFINAQEATADLPDIMDGKADCCISFPDHRVAAVGVTKSLRTQMSVIPMHPHGMNFRKTWNKGKGVMTVAERSLFPEKGERVNELISNSWGRALPGKVMPTITTTPTPTDARVGFIMHWEQDRVLTIMEARRAQGFRDHEVLLGTPKDQWKVVGNSVARGVSLALGLSFRQAWLGSLVDGDEVAPKFHIAQDVSDDVQMMDPPPLAESRTSISGSASPASSSSRAVPAKRPLGSTLLVERFTSKMTKSSRTQTSSGNRTTVEVEGEVQAEVTTSLVTSDIEIIEID
ncbi:cytosine-specific methyltransferase [Colletotrichum nymphaeae SA-01]|uniref:DNA (cytosine-5-)-methyltransferase n=1 Tax=Colletotrichum nymphaeae SA-01 TaxID=1460502 RepID=A0A135UUZ6_9PEZI|nr:cytosine-specific methyltransferase [Colletotrichum nymphaeae SA-01]